MYASVPPEQILGGQLTGPADLRLKPEQAITGGYADVKRPASGINCETPFPVVHTTHRFRQCFEVTVNRCNHEVLAHRARLAPGASLLLSVPKAFDAG